MYQDVFFIFKPIGFKLHERALLIILPSTNPIKTTAVEVGGESEKKCLHLNSDISNLNYVKIEKETPMVHKKRKA